MYEYTAQSSDHAKCEAYPQKVIKEREINFCNDWNSEITEYLIDKLIAIFLS